MELIKISKASEGIVIKKNGDFALVRPLVCSISCSCHDDEVGAAIVDAKNEVNAAVGDKVIYEVPEEGMLMAAFIIFILPIILVILGAATGYNMAESLSINPTFATIAGACLSFLTSIVIIKLHDKSASNNVKLLPIITGISSENYLDIGASNTITLTTENALDNGEKS